MPEANFFRTHPVLAFFALTFAISWGAVLLVIGSLSPIPASPEQTSGLLGLSILLMLLGPFLAGITLTAMLSGRKGLGEMRTRLLRWRVGARWHAFAVLTAPLLATTTLLVLMQFSPVYLPGIIAADDKASLLIFGIMGGLMVGLFEETGWTGFATPRLRSRYGILATGLIIGLLWGVWHFLVSYWGSGDSSGAFSITLFIPPLIFYVGVLPAYRVLMVWAHDRTESMLVVVLMHGFLTASIPLIITPLSITWMPLSAWYMVLTASLWLVIGKIFMADGGLVTKHSMIERTDGSATVN